MLSFSIELRSALLSLNIDQTIVCSDSECSSFPTVEYSAVLSQTIFVEMSRESPTIKDKELKTEAHVTQPSNKNSKKNDVPKVSYVRDTDDVSKRPTVQDGIRKEVVRHERKSQATWDEKFSFLSGEVFHEILGEEAVKAGLPSDTFKRKKVDSSIVRHFPMNLSPSPPVPKTSLALVGWRSAREEYRLEFKGQMYISPKRTIDPPLEPGAAPMAEQRFIILG